MHEDMPVDHGDKADELHYMAEFKFGCVWMYLSFTHGHSAREAVVHGLATAKEYLAVAKVTSLICQSMFIDDALVGIRCLGRR